MAKAAQKIKFIKWYKTRLEHEKHKKYQKNFYLYLLNIILRENSFLIFDLLGCKVMLITIKMEIKDIANYEFLNNFTFPKLEKHKYLGMVQKFVQTISPHWQQRIIECIKLLKYELWNLSNL